MKTLFLILVGFVFFMFGCENQQPMTPELTEQGTPIPLAKQKGTSFTADCFDWFVRSQEEPGEFTFAQFDLDDPDVTVLPNGHVLLRDRELSSPLTGDLENDDWMHAVELVISASLNSDLNGPAHGTIRITATWGDLTGTFEGRFSGFFSDDRWRHDLFDGIFHARGIAGDFLGMEISGTMTELPAPGDPYRFILEGQIR